jgi:hypothetical protein
MKVLENRTLDSKREMDIIAALDEMRSLKARHAQVSTEDALAALRREGEGEGEEGGGARGGGAAGGVDGVELPEEDAAALAEFFAQQRSIMRRIEESPSGSDSGEDVPAGPLPPQQQHHHQQQQQQQPASSSRDAGGTSTAASKPKAPLVKVLVKPKRPAAAGAAAAAAAATPDAAGAASKRAKVEGDGSKAGVEGGGALLDLGGYGSDSSD